MVENNKWHLDKRISWGHIVVTVSIAVSAGWWFVKNESRFSALESRVAAQERVQNNYYAEMIRRLERIEDLNARHLEYHSRGWREDQ